MLTAPADRNFARRALLPAGLSDELPPAAEHRARILSDLLATFGQHGYERVEPPLVEFEESLLPPGAAVGMAQQTFRVMDPVSQRMMGVRADMTVQVARIATSRLSHSPRPLRLSYAGPVLRVKGSQLRPERQVSQAGAELIGASGIAADVEALRLAVDALVGLGVKRLSADLNCAPLVAAIFDAYGITDGQADEVRAALDRKDADAIPALAGPAATALGGLLAATGPAQAAAMILTTLDLPEAAALQRARLDAVITALQAALPTLTLTVDPVENRGFEYYSGVGFTLFARGVRGELGRGGRYTVEDGNGGEPATGFSLFLDSVIEALPPPAPPRRIFLPLGTDGAQGAALRAEGWITVAALEPVADAAAEAKRLACGHMWFEGRVTATS